jgi:hypothetical protein
MAGDGSTSAAAARNLLRRGRSAVSRWLRPALDGRAAPGLLTSEQLATLRALTEPIVGGAPLGDEAWEPVRVFLVGAARSQGGYRTLCVRACCLLDRLVQGRFATLSLLERTATVAAARLAVRPVPAAERLLFGRRVEHEIRELLVPDLIRAYFDSPAGWAMVGYEAALGECRDPWAYTRKPS